MREFVDISDLSGYKTPAIAHYFISYNGDNLKALQEATQFAIAQDLPILTISGGKNLLLAFDEYPGLVIHNGSKGFSFSEENSILHVKSGNLIWSLAEEIEKNYNINVWHRFQGLPGSVGGAVFGNAGCFGLEIGPYVKSITVLNIRTGEMLSLAQEDLHFNYRWSECKNHPEWFILDCTFDLSQLIEKYSSTEDPLEWRSRVQPEGLSCGSFFKNPSREQSAGSLIESVGLKGFKIGGAFFSDKHANFLMSDGTATWQDLTQLVQLAQEKVKAQYGIELEPEVRIIRT